MSLLRRLAMPCARRTFLHRILSNAALLILALGLILSMYGTVQAQVVCGSKAYLDSLPVKPPKNPSIKRQVQLINCSDQVILGAASAAHEAGLPPYPVFPQEEHVGDATLQVWERCQRAHH